MEVLPKDVQLIIHRYLHCGAMRQVQHELYGALMYDQRDFDVLMSLATQDSSIKRCKTCKRWYIQPKFNLFPWWGVCFACKMTLTRNDRDPLSKWLHTHFFGTQQ